MKTVSSFLAFFFLMLQISCKDNFSRQDESYAVQEVLKFYGGVCLKSKGLDTSIEKGNISFFELEISKSNLLEKYSKKLKIPASNIALIFYNNLEKRKFDEIKVKIKLKNGKIAKYSFTSHELDTIIGYKHIINIINESIIKNDFEKLTSYFSNDVKKEINKNQIENLFNEFNQSYGRVLNIQMQGFLFSAVKEKDNIPLILIPEVIIRKGENTRLSLYFNSNNKLLYSIGFD